MFVLEGLQASSTFAGLILKKVKMLSNTNGFSDSFRRIEPLGRARHAWKKISLRSL